MSFTHSCAHAHLIPIFPASQRYHGSSIVPNKSSSVEGGSLSSRISWHSLEGAVTGSAAAAVATQPGLEVPLPQSLGFNPPHCGARLSLFRVIFQEDKAMQSGGREQIVGHLEGFQLMYSLSVCLQRTLDLPGRWPGECRVCVGDQGCTLHRALNFQGEHPCLVIQTGIS